MDSRHIRARTTRSVNLHLAPGSEKLIDAVPPDTVVEIIEKRQQPRYLWAFVFVPSRNEHGWCRDDFLAVDENVVPLPPPKPIELPQPGGDELAPVETSSGVPLWAWVALAAAVILGLASCALGGTP